MKNLFGFMGNKDELKDLLNKKLNILAKKRDELNKIKEEKENNEKDINDLEKESQKLTTEYNNLELEKNDLMNLENKVFLVEKDVKDFKSFKKIFNITGLSLAAILLIVTLAINAGTLLNIFLPVCAALLGFTVPLPFYKSNFENEMFLRENNIDDIEKLLEENNNQMEKNRNNFISTNERINVLKELNNVLDGKIEQISIEIEKFEEISNFILKGTSTIKETISSVYKNIKDNLNAKENLKEENTEQAKVTSHVTLEDILSFLQKFGSQETKYEEINLEEDENQDTDSVQKIKK